MGKKLYVGNLPFSATQSELDELFGQVGTVESVNIITDKFSGESRGFGFVTPDDSWENRWRVGPNAILRFSDSLPGSGAGAKSLGQELAGSEAFARCHVEKVFRNVCFRGPVDQADRNRVTSMIANFRSSNYNLKTVFADAAAHCMGE